MTEEQFDKTKWKYGMYALYKGRSYFVHSRCHDERLLGLKADCAADEDIFWVRCESVEDVR